MLSFGEAVEQLVQAGRGLHANVVSGKIPVLQALGKVLAGDVVSSVDVPPRDNSAMDGYAFRYADAAAAGFSLPLSQRIPAGTAPAPLEGGTAARIFTGAEIPENADTVAMQEDCRAGDGEVSIDGDQVRRGDHIRPRGQDIRRGETVLAAGRRIRAQEMGLLYSVGCETVPVFQPLRVAILSTGNELVEPGRDLAPGQIYNSNRATLHGLLTAWGLDVVDLGIVGDTPAAVEAALLEAEDSADMIVTSGGVSVGEEDHVRQVVDKLGSLEFWKIAIKPGKPLAFGHIEGTPFMGLPGNPASTFVTACLFLRPFLLSMQGCERAVPMATTESSTFGKKPGGRQEFIRARRGAGGLEMFPNQSSGVLSGACWGDGLAVQPAGQAIAPGDRVQFYPFTEFL